MFTFDETTDVGADTGAPVTDDYPARGNAFTGTVKWVQLDSATTTTATSSHPSTTSRSP